MAINKKLVHFKTFAKFNEELSAGNILDTSICWIKDTKQIWTHGQFYDCSSLTDENIVGTALVGYTESVETNENLDLTAEDTIVGAFGKLVKAIKDNEEVDSAAFVKLRDSVGLDENLEFSTTAGDTNVTEAIERIDGRISSAKPPVNITDLYFKVSGAFYSYSDEDYNTLINYANSGTVTYVNDEEREDARQIFLLNMYSTLVMVSNLTDYNGTPMVEYVTLDPRYRIARRSSIYCADNQSIGTAILKNYESQALYSNIKSSDTISMALGKLEANVKKIVSTGDGTKFLSDDGTYKNAGGGSVDITDIMLRLNELAEVSGTCTDEDYNALKGYTENGISVFFSPEDISFIPLTINNNGGNITISYEMSTGSINHYGVLMIDTQKLVSVASLIFPASTMISQVATLNEYSKPSAYSAITESDTISSAIGKLEAGLYTKSISGSSGTVTQKLSPNTYYKFGECTSLTITLGAEVAGILNEYMFEFVSGATATVLGLPETVKWNNGNAPTIEANKTYIVAIVNNIAVIGGA